jgi:hypothetical protein
MQRACLAVATAFLLVPPPAAAGGWWTSPRLSRDTVAVGQEVRVHAGVMFSSADAVEAAQYGRSEERYYVYLLRGFDRTIVERAMRKPSPRNWWSLGDAEAIRVGPVVLGSSSLNTALANASFTVPPLPIGTYTVMLCDAGCTRPLADVIPASGFTIVADPVTARLAAQTGRLELQGQRLAARLDKTSAEAFAAQSSASISQAELAGLRDRLDETERRVASAERSIWKHVSWLFAGVALGVMLVIALRHRRSLSRPSPHTAVRVARPRSSSRGGRPPDRRRRSGVPSSRRA